MKLIFQAVLDGFLLGGIYSTLALGFSVAYGIMGIINWAAGDILMLGLFLAYELITNFGMDPYLTIIITFTVIGALGFVMQKYVFNHILNNSGNRAGHNILLFTAGFAFVAEGAMELIYTTNPISVQTAYTGKSIMILGAYAPVPKIISCAIAIIASLILYYFIHKSELGRAIRATSQDRSTAQLMGINAMFVFCLALAISFGMLGLTASLLVPYYPVHPYVGTAFSFKALIIVVIGGRGNILGALVGGIFIALFEKVLGALISDTLAQILVFALFILVLLVKPDGLLNKRAAH